MKYALFNSAGELIGRYDSDIHASIPDEAIEIDDALFWQTINENDGAWKRGSNGVLTKHPFPPEDPRIALRAEIEALNGPLPDQKLKGRRELDMVLIAEVLAPGKAQRLSVEQGRTVTVEEVLANERTYQVLLEEKLRAKELEQQLEALGG